MGSDNISLHLIKISFIFWLYFLSGTLLSIKFFSSRDTPAHLMWANWDMELKLMSEEHAYFQAILFIILFSQMHKIGPFLRSVIASPLGKQVEFCRNYWTNFQVIKNFYSFLLISECDTSME